MNIWVFGLVIALLIADALIFYVAGVSVDITKKLKSLKNQGWTIEPPKDAE